MDNREMIRRIAQLEFEHDQLLAEINYIDGLLRRVGFSEGLETVKWAAKGLVEQPIDDERE